MSEHKGQTNEVTEVKLPSAIEQVQWTQPRAAPGGTAGLEVFTRFVGHGAPVEIKLTDEQGRSHGTFKDGLYANRLTAEIQVPPKAEGALFAEVKLAKHGLSKKSPPLLLVPPVAIRNAKWSQAEARRGDVLTLSADVKGAPDGTEAQITLFEHDADGAHDRVTRFSALVEGERVEAEWEYEYHADTDDIPRDEEVEQGYTPPEYFFRVEVAGVTEKSDLLTFKDWVEIVLETPGGEPIGGEQYTVTFPDGTVREGTLDADGRARLEDVPPGPVDVVYPIIDGEGQ